MGAAVAGTRPCVGCGAPLSRYNRADHCAACVRPVGTVAVVDAVAGLSLGPCLKRLRRMRGLTQDQLAGLAAVSSSYVKKLERGVCCSASVVTLRSLARVLGVPVGVLLASTEVRDAVTVARHGQLAGRFADLVVAGDDDAARALLRRAAGDRAVNPWLFLEEFTRRVGTEVVPL